MFSYDPFTTPKICSKGVISIINQKFHLILDSTAFLVEHFSGCTLVCNIQTFNRGIGGLFRDSVMCTCTVIKLIAH